MLKKRRSLIKWLGIIGAGAFLYAALKLSIISNFKTYYYRILNRFKGPVEIPPENERTLAEFHSDGPLVSAELAMNSRCTSDYDDNQKTFHWGMFDKENKLSPSQIAEVVNLSKIARFTNKSARINIKDNMLTFTIDGKASGIEREWLMIESGMQQQAVGLVCAALGVGMVFRNSGKNGKQASEDEYETIKIKLDAQKPSYGGAYWSNLKPSGWKEWEKGNLPDPIRNGNNSLISTLSELRKENIGSTEITDIQIGQLLWAARGRTPHLYKSRPWGMTIPTWAGKQDIAEVNFITKSNYYRYENWKNNKPTHNLVVIGEIIEKNWKQILKHFIIQTGIIILKKNENTGRALWEIGYQLQNLIIQASSLSTGYRAVLLDQDEKKLINSIGIENGIAAMVI